MGIRFDRHTITQLQSNEKSIEKGGGVFLKQKDDSQRFVNDAYDSVKLKHSDAVPGVVQESLPNGNICKRNSVASEIRQLQKAVKELETQQKGLVGCGGDCSSDCGGIAGYSSEEEWRVVAQTFDRCLFVLFILIFGIGTIACFAHTTYVT